MSSGNSESSATSFSYSIFDGTKKMLATYNDMHHALIEVPAKHPSVAPRPRRQCHRLPKTHYFELKKNLILIYYYQIIE